MRKKIFSILVLLCLAVSGAWALTGSGTSSSPYLIGSLDDWNAFAAKTNAGENTAWGKLTANIEGVTTMAGSDKNSPYSGTFDGDGFSITLNINTTDDYAGLFRYAKNATIKNLNLKGTITSTKKFIGSFVGYFSGGTNSLQNICSSVAISSSLSGDLTSGGIVAHSSSDVLTITDCLFIGSITGSNGGNMCGGIIGYAPGGATMTRVIQAGTFTIGTSNYDGVFSRNNDNVLTATDCYYINGVGGTATCSKATQITASQLNTQTYVDLLQTGKSETYWGLKNGVLTWVSDLNHIAKFVYNGKTIMTLYTPEEGGTVNVPSVAEMESTYYIQDATFTYAGAPFTSSTFFDTNIEVTVGGTLLVGSVEMSASATTIDGGETAIVSVNITPSYADYTLSSSNPAVATVAQDGTVTYVKAGTTTITATAVNDPSKTATLDITCSDVSVVAIDENANPSGNQMPFTNFYNHGTTQQLYTPAEVGPACTIKALAFKVATASNFATTSLKIYLGHKSGTFADASDYVPASNLTLVYDGAPTLGAAAGWEKLQFNQNGGEFEYNGTDNLVVVVCKSTVSYNGNLKYSGLNKIVYSLYRQDDNNINYADITSDVNYNTAVIRPSVKFWVEYPRTRYYVVGNMNDWSVNDNYEMTLNEGAAPVEEYMFTMDLKTSNQLKVVKGGETVTWYPSEGSNYGEYGEISADGNYTIYFRPNGNGGDDWFYHVIYVAKNYNHVTLNDNEDNSGAISAANGQLSQVTLHGRTLYKDASWNTLCLPFAVSDFSGTPLEGAIVKELTSAVLNGSELTLNWSDALTAIEAGKPYLVQWPAGENLVNPVFSGVTVNNTVTDKVCELNDEQSITFKGITSPVQLSANDMTKLYLGSDNTLYYPGEDMSVNACRAYFLLSGIEVEGAAAAPSLRVILNLNGENVATSVQHVTHDEQVVKFQENGQIYILREGVVYDVLGRMVRK